MNFEVLAVNATVNLIKYGGLLLLLYLIYRGACSLKLIRKARKREMRIAKIGVLVGALMIAFYSVKLTYEPDSTRFDMDRATFDRHESQDLEGPTSDTYLKRYPSEIDEHKRRMEEQRAISKRHLETIQETQ